jgi:hypothetical protein
MCCASPAGTRRGAPPEHREFDILQSGPLARDPAVTLLLHGRTDALVEFLRDIGVIPRHLEEAREGPRAH